jgi:predicted 3-demethylubiquinone-9 3-methyltransferase (glyoxalase superfamily)
LSWQIVPTRLGELLSAPDRDAADRALQAMLQMIKLDIDGLESAFNAA